TQLTDDRGALRLFFTDDIYLVNEPVTSDITTKTAVPEPDVPNVMVIEPARPEVAEPKYPNYDSFESLGNNQKNILILVNDALNKVSTEKGSELLRNIVKAINLSANDFALVNYAQYPGASYAQFKSFFSGKLVFCFGVGAIDLQLEERPFNEIHTLDDGSRIIFCHNLEQLADDQPNKKLLWGNLKKLNL